MQYNKIDEVTIEAHQSIDGGYGKLSRIFNFEAQQLVILYQKEKYNAGYALASSMTTHNFADLPNPAEIEKMHAKLVEKGGTPPELSTIVPFNGKIAPANFDQVKKGLGNG
jgi:hypothetical protein